MTLTAEKEEVKTLFVGNLSPEITSSKIKEMFGSQVVSVKLIKRFGKFKGYGFVHLKGDADQICKEFNGKTVEGKELKVEVAEPKKPHVAPAAESKTTKAPKEAQQTNGSEEGTVAVKEVDQKPKKKRKPRKKKPVVSDGAAPSSEAAPKEDKPQKPKRAPRPPKKVRSPDEPLSDTLVFVGNLPFQVSSEDLKEIFASFGVVSARVVTFGKKSKGYGFVEFKDKDAVKHVIEDFAECTLENRVLVVKQAYAQDEKKEEKKE